MHALAALLLQPATDSHRQQQLHHVRRAVDDGGIDHCAFARTACVEDAGKQADGEIQCAPPISPSKVMGEDGASPAVPL
ncbi:hypothetical protein D9M68_806890 [compost metagenome]